MSFFQTVMAGDPLVAAWVIWLTAITTLAWVVFLFNRTHWIDAAIVFALNLGVTVAMQFLFETRGFGPHLSLPHLVFWLPLLAYILWRLRLGAFEGVFRMTAIVLAASLAVSLVLDIRDLALMWSGAS
jgi:hypothetical protein